MNLKQSLLALVTIDFAALCGYALYHHGLSGMIETITTNSMSMALTADLAIALSIGVWWTWQDARSRGINPLPYALLTAATGSPGLLIYLIRRRSTPALTLAAAA